tara:strand:- start:218 stop:739 length:522 start_codon:yes stop_codon:yes gene_type:complete
MKREEFKVTQKKETKLILRLSERLLANNIHAGNTVLVSVSGDYSCLVGQMLRHSLSCDGEICDGFSVDVPYPDETWDETYLLELKTLFELYKYKIKNKNILLVEAGVIRGSNYKFIIEYLKNTLGITKEIHTLALYENSRSKFKSNFVAHYYDDETEDLTFWWERYNNHWNKR